MKYTFGIAMDIRAYGSVTVDGITPDNARSRLTAEYVADHFLCRGAGDVDFNHPQDIRIYDEGVCVDGNDKTHSFTGSNDIADGPWVLSTMTVEEEIDKVWRRVVEPQQNLIRDLWWFIENVTEETPDHNDRFFTLRERVRSRQGLGEKS